MLEDELKEVEQLLVECQSKYGPVHPEVAGNLLRLAALLRAAGRLEEATNAEYKATLILDKVSAQQEHTKPSEQQQHFRSVNMNDSWRPAIPPQSSAPNSIKSTESSQTSQQSQCIAANASPSDKTWVNTLGPQRLKGERTFDVNRLSGKDQRATIRVTSGDFGSAIWDFDAASLTMHSRIGEVPLSLDGNIKSLSIISEKTVKDQKQATLGTIAGSLLGPVGGAIGYMVAGNVKEFCIDLTLKDNRRFVALVDERIYQVLFLATPKSSTSSAEDSEDRYECPFCAELIKRAAKICRFCKSELA